MYDPLIALVIGVLLVAGGALLFWPEKGLFNRWQRSRRVTQRVLSEDALKHIHEAQLQGQRPTLHSSQARCRSARIAPPICWPISINAGC